MDIEKFKFEQPISEAAESDALDETPAEFSFHQERFRRMAEAHDNRWFLKKLLDRNRQMTATDFAHEEALRDNADFDRRQHEEFKAWEEDLKPVLDNILEKKNNPENKEIRPLLLILGGGMKGPYGAGQVLGLNEAGITSDTFDTIVGISAGAGAAAYYAGGPEQTRRGASLFYEECATREFIDYTRLGKVMDVEKLTLSWMGEGEKALDQNAIQNSNTELYFAVTQLPSDGSEPKAEFIDAKTADPGLLPAMRASMSVPLVAGEVPPVNGIEYVDGAFDPMPVEAIIEKFKPTDILILPNTPFDRLDTFKLSPTIEVIAELARKLGSAGSLVSLGQLEKFLLIKEQLRKSMAYIRDEKKVNIGILWPPDSGLAALKRNSDDVKAAVYESARGVIAAFGQNQPKEIPIYESK